MNQKEKYTKETGQDPFCWSEIGEYLRSGSYSDGYVKWLEKQLNIPLVGDKCDYGHNDGKGNDLYCCTKIKTK